MRSCQVPYSRKKVSCSGRSSGPGTVRPRDVATLWPGQTEQLVFALTPPQLHMILPAIPRCRQAFVQPTTVRQQQHRSSTDHSVQLDVAQRTTGYIVSRKTTGRAMSHAADAPSSASTARKRSWGGGGAQAGKTRSRRARGYGACRITRQLFVQSCFFRSHVVPRQPRPTHVDQGASSANRPGPKPWEATPRKNHAPCDALLLIPGRSARAHSTNNAL